MLRRLGMMQAAGTACLVALTAVREALTVFSSPSVAKVFPHDMRTCHKDAHVGRPLPGCCQQLPHAFQDPLSAFGDETGETM